MAIEAENLIINFIIYRSVKDYVRAKLCFIREDTKVTNDDLCDIN